MTTRAIEAALFDVGNVLGYFDHSKACEKLAALTNGNYTGEEIRLSLFASNGLATLFEKGQIDTKSFMQSVCRELGILPFDVIEEFEELWGDIFTDTGMSPILARMKPFVKMGILSNTDPIHWKYIEQLPVIEKYFKNSVYLTTSFEMRTKKPDPQIYVGAARKCACDPRKIVFLDDLNANVEAAKSLGFHARRFDARGHTPEFLSDLLSQYGLIE